MYKAYETLVPVLALPLALIGEESDSGCILESALVTNDEWVGDDGDNIRFELSFPSLNLNEILTVEENAGFGIKLVYWTWKLGKQR
jgi:hypothetical protein